MAGRADLLLEGDECDSCRSFWAKQGSPPQKLISLNRHTENREVPIVVCPYCDGEPLLERRVDTSAQTDES